MNQPVNPYIVGRPLITKHHFFGHHDILDWVVQELKSPSTNALVLYGQRRIGKTSLLYRVEAVLADEGFLPILFDLQDQSDRPLGEVLADLASKVSELANMPQIEVKNFDDKGNYFRNKYIPCLLKKLGSDKKPVFLFDEFDVIDFKSSANLQKNAAANALFPFLHQLLTEQGSISFVFAIGRQAEDLSTFTKSVFKSALIKEVWVLDRESAEKLIRQAEENFTLRYTDQAVSRIIDLTKGHAYLTQLLCSRIWQQKAPKNASFFPPEVTPNDVENAIQDALEAGNQALDWLWDGLRPTEKVYLSAFAELAPEGESLSRSYILEVMARNAERLRSHEVELAPEDLVKRHILELDGDRMEEYRFSIELFRLWVKKNKPLSRTKDVLDQINPKAELYFDSGFSAFLQKDYQAAISLFKKAIRKNPYHFRAKLYLGEAFLEADELNNAIDELEEAYDEDRSEAAQSLLRALIMKAQENFKARKYDLVVETCEKALEIFPMDSTVQDIKKQAEQRIIKSKERERRESSQEIVIVSDEIVSEKLEEVEISNLQNNQLYDFITNQPVKDTPLERGLQTIARALVDEYEFDHTQLQRDCMVTFEVIDEHGKVSKMRRKIDVAVFAEGANRQDQNKIIRACIVQAPGTKASDPRKGVNLLEEVLSGLSACEYGLWTNGTDLVFKRKLSRSVQLEPDYDELYDLPGNGETAADLDDPERPVGRIATGDNLQRTFARVHDYIYGNQGLRGDAAFWQVLNLTFCKIYDERSTGKRRFWVKGTERNSPEGQAAIAKRIKGLFDDVKKDQNYSSVFTERDRIELNDRVLAFAIGEFSRYNLSETDVDVKGAAYEEITSSMLKSQRGQFFTPTNVIRLMIQMIDPGDDKDLTDAKNWPRILDPACGSGRFLTYALDYIRRKLAAQLFPNEHHLLQVLRMDRHPQHKSLAHDFACKCLFGIDFDPDLKRAARMNMILNNDGHGNILSFNSLEFPLMIAEGTVAELRAKHLTESSANTVEEPSLSDSERAILRADLGTMDFVFTNPPFGAKIPIDDPGILQQFDLGHRWVKSNDHWIMKPELQVRVAPEVLFVERCVQWVKPGTGKVAIVLPDGILGNPDSAPIRYWILTHCQVLASVDLPVEAFLPQVGVQASLLFLRRKSQAQIEDEAKGNQQDYSVFMAVAEKVGHDRRGVTIYQRDADGAEIISPETRISLRRRKKRLMPILVETPVLDKRVDDDLPKIGQAYQRFLKTGQVDK